MRHDGRDAMDVKLIMFRENGSRREFSISPGVTTIGRKDDCNIRIPLASVSRRHAELHAEEDSVVVKALGAANGTYLNGHRVTEEDLEPGDQLMIGPVIFTLQIDGEPSNDEIVEVRSKISADRPASKRGPSVGTSEHVYTPDEEVDPISALEALASSADQTAIDPEDDS